MKSKQERNRPIPLVALRNMNQLKALVSVVFNGLGESVSHQKGQNQHPIHGKYLKFCVNMTIINLVHDFEVNFCYNI